MSYIAFNDKIPFPMLYAIEDTRYVTSVKDVDESADRKVLSIHFDMNAVTQEELDKYFINADELTSVITIVDDAGQPFIHLDFCIPIILGKEMVNDDPNPHIVLRLAKLTTKDKLLRVLAGKDKVYTGTPLEIAIEKKIDEMSKECTQNIYDGIDIPLTNGETKHFTFDGMDQTDITGIGLEMVMGSNLIMWHDDMEDEDCEIYSKEDMGIILSVLSLHRKYNISYFRNLRRYLRSLNSTEDVQEKLALVDVVWYGMELPEEFKSDTFKIIVNEMGGLIELEKATMTPPPDYTELNKTILEQQTKWAKENGLIPDESLIDVIAPEVIIGDDTESDEIEEGE